LIDRINDLICPLYGLTSEETDFIKNYEIEFRLGAGRRIIEKLTFWHTYATKLYFFINGTNIEGINYN